MTTERPDVEGVVDGVLQVSRCAPFVCDDPGYDKPWKALMRCPGCKGWLPQDFPIGRQFLCLRCGAVLGTIPDEDDDPDCELGGRLCVVPPDAVTISTILPPKKIRRRRKKTTKIAHGLLFTRRVWTDRDGTFIEVNGERILINDPRISLVTEELSP